MHDGVVVWNIFFGNTGTASQATNNTLTHEVGHYLGLEHVWGNAWSNDPCLDKCDLSVPCEDINDYCCDTDPVKGGGLLTSDCSETASTCESCSGFPQGEYFYPLDNYMGYAAACQDKFTEDQAIRMIATINSYRPDLISYENPSACCEPESDMWINTTQTIVDDMYLNGNIYILIQGLNLQSLQLFNLLKGKEL